MPKFVFWETNKKKLNFMCSCRILLSLKIKKIGDMVAQIGLLQQRDAEYLRKKCVCVGRDGSCMEKINLSIWRLDINKKIDILVR